MFQRSRIRASGKRQAAERVESAVGDECPVSTASSLASHFTDQFVERLGLRKAKQSPVQWPPMLGCRGRLAADCGTPPRVCRSPRARLLVCSVWGGLRPSPNRAHSLARSHKPMPQLLT